MRLDCRVGRNSDASRAAWARHAPLRGELTPTPSPCLQRTSSRRWSSTQPARSSRRAIEEAEWCCSSRSTPELTRYVARRRCVLAFCVRSRGAAVLREAGEASSSFGWPCCTTRWAPQRRATSGVHAGCCASAARRRRAAVVPFLHGWARLRAWLRPLRGCHTPPALRGCFSRRLACSLCPACSAGGTRLGRTDVRGTSLTANALLPQGARGGGAAGGVEYRYLTEFQSHEPEVRSQAASPARLRGC